MNAKSYSVAVAVILSFTQPLSVLAATSQPLTVQPNNTSEIKIALFERFTEQAIKVIMLAQEESRSLGHNYIGTEHILLGLLNERDGIAAKVLKANGVDLNNARLEVEKITGRGAGSVAVEIPFTPGAKKLLEQSLVESQKLKSNFIGTEHLLLGLIEQKDDIGAKVLNNLKVNLSKIRPQTIQMLKTAPSKPA